MPLLPRARSALRRLRGPVSSSAVWLVFFLSYTVQGVIHSVHPGAFARRDPGATLLVASADLLQAALLAAVCYALAAGALSRRVSGARVTVLVLLGAVFLPLARMAGMAAVERLFAFPVSTRALLLGMPGEFMVTAGFLGLGFTVAYAAGAQARELAVGRLERELAQARLQALQAQLHPHFLFNAFNSVAALMHRDVEAADRMLARLGALLRRLLRRADAQLVSMDEELEFARMYLEVEQVRFGARLEVRIEADPAARDAVVPYLLLQPLVENAVRHGIAPVAAGGRVEVRVAVDGGDMLEVEVRDTGRGLPADWRPERGGIGLANVRSRLAEIYDGSHSFQVESPPEGGVRIRLRLPFSPPPERLEPFPPSPSDPSEGDGTEDAEEGPGRFDLDPDDAGRTP